MFVCDKGKLASFGEARKLYLYLFEFFFWIGLERWMENGMVVYFLLGFFVFYVVSCLYKIILWFLGFLDFIIVNIEFIYFFW